MERAADSEHITKADAEKMVAEVVAERLSRATV